MLFYSLHSLRNEKLKRWKKFKTFFKNFLNPAALLKSKKKECKEKLFTLFMEWNIEKVKFFWKLFIKFFP